MSNPSKRRGDRAELEVARLISDHLGITVKRRLGAGRKEDEGDMWGIPDCVVEVKSYSSVGDGVNAALADLERERLNAGVPFAAGFVRRRGGTYAVVMTPEHFAALYREATT